MAPWPSGKARVCKTLIPGPNPGGASKKAQHPRPFGEGAVLFALTRIRGRIAATRRPGGTPFLPSMGIKGVFFGVPFAFGGATLMPDQVLPQSRPVATCKSFISVQILTEDR